MAIDFETTGLDLHRDAVVSFGLVPIHGGRVELGRSDYTNVSPETPLSHRSITVHHLRPVDLDGAPPLAQVAGRLRDGVEGRFLVAWAARIEATFLSRTLGGSVRRWLARTVDVLPLAVIADRLEGGYGEETSYALADVVERHGLPVLEAHDAFNDALMTAELFLVLATRLSTTGHPDVGSLLRPGPSAFRRLVHAIIPSR